ncbi:hypothetical protein COO60DRAFT_1528358 [Scenedesmus sp. NREL 46B-D3]|nr:hypothetical protein COO60DRAFT_1528358 [Scenedesmus sp. NREL 46B-D3]
MLWYVLLLRCCAAVSLAALSAAAEQDRRHNNPNHVQIAGAFHVHKPRSWTAMRVEVFSCRGRNLQPQPHPCVQVLQHNTAHSSNPAQHSAEGLAATCEAQTPGHHLPDTGIRTEHGIQTFTKKTQHVKRLHIAAQPRLPMQEAIRR